MYVPSSEELLSTRLRPFFKDTSLDLVPCLLFLRAAQLEQDQVLGRFSTGGSTQWAWNPCSQTLQMRRGSYESTRKRKLPIHIWRRNWLNLRFRPFLHKCCSSCIPNRANHPLPSVLTFQLVSSRMGEPKIRTRSTKWVLHAHPGCSSRWYRDIPNRTASSTASL